jgi:hypothetical protein
MFDDFPFLIKDDTVSNFSPALFELIVLVLELKKAIDIYKVIADFYDPKCSAFVSEFCIHVQPTTKAI